MSDFVHVEPPVDSHDPPTVTDAPNNPSISLPLAFLDTHPFVRAAVLDKIYGCIIGSALGDTIGLYTEFLTKAQSAEIYASRKFRLVEPATELYLDNHRTRFEPCAWTDDTDQALLIVLAYLDTCAHAALAAGPAQQSTQIHESTTISTSHPSPPNQHAVKDLSSSFAERLRIWVEQGLLALRRPPCGLGRLVGSVVLNPSFLSNPLSNATAAWEKTQRHVAPNGSLMRTHPLGVIGVGLSEEAAWDLSVDVGRVTHVDPRCVVSCAISVGLVRGLLRGEIVDESGVDAAIERAYAFVKSRPDLMNPGDDADLTTFEIERHLERREFERHIYAKSLEELKLDNHKEMGYVYKCLGSAVFTLRLAMQKNIGLQPLDAMTLFEELTVELIMEGGDADTNAAAACALLGAYLGYARLPVHWTLGLAHKEWLMEKTRRLAVAANLAKGPLEVQKDEAAEGPEGKMNQDQLDYRWQMLIVQMVQRKKEGEERAKAAKKEKKGIAGWFAK
ncbi:ADP-ribosylglycohydrolase-domain-containing protein [Paraphoma chrysanthemicola]|uniref:ADP-ribosylglycohydrolase-domain-containing protein n=1 Tax=Paraphoma chrysanthemicola TaxID=798071 RepID=A0A8K0QZ44_9PLEO|nr:ADP-ribosylglycohydrolase-domain-containing protein [Paraphoma chrysanthemicola]